MINYGVDLLLQPMTMVWGMWLAFTSLDAWHAMPRCTHLAHMSFTPYFFWSSGLALECSELAINLARLGIFVVFAVTYAMLPFRRFFFTVWARVIESDKPVFTLTLAGTATLVKSVHEIVKLF